MGEMGVMGEMGGGDRGVGGRENAQKTGFSEKQKTGFSEKPVFYSCRRQNGE
jgi:hypothetical protein